MGEDRPRGPASRAELSGEEDPVAGTARGRLGRRLYGRSAGKPLSARREALLSDLLPRLTVAVHPPGALDPASLFDGRPVRVVLEIGFGAGEHLVAQATSHPETGYVGVEPFLDGVAKVLVGIDAAGLTNIWLRRGDARDLLDELAPGVIDRVFILFPDPWPKARHHKRRLIQPAFLDQLARVLAPEAEVRFATDWADYANEALLVFTRHARFRWRARSAMDWRAPPSDHVPTRYQQKGLGDCSPVYYDFDFLG
ncbi:tRNA (guanosine(46)-N7)-methyltransferase TrmB [bacterium]|nr:tRNA (guanosine(46)-N7)-methyltransferase TrmB [bacterium]